MDDINTGWLCIEGGVYQRGRWTIRRFGKGQWWLFESGQLRGSWKLMGCWRAYQPFSTLQQAKDAVERASGSIPQSLAC